MADPKTRQEAINVRRVLDIKNEDKAIFKKLLEAFQEASKRGDQTLVFRGQQYWLGAAGQALNDWQKAHEKQEKITHRLKKSIVEGIEEEKERQQQEKEAAEKGKKEKQKLDQSLVPDQFKQAGAEEVIGEAPEQVLQVTQYLEQQREFIRQETEIRRLQQAISNQAHQAFRERLDFLATANVDLAWVGSQEAVNNYILWILKNHPETPINSVASRAMELAAAKSGGAQFLQNRLAAKKEKLSGKTPDYNANLKTANQEIGKQIETSVRSDPKLKEALKLIEPTKGGTSNAFMETASSSGSPNKVISVLTDRIKSFNIPEPKAKEAATRITNIAQAATLSNQAPQNPQALLKRIEQIVTQKKSLNDLAPIVKQLSTQATQETQAALAATVQHTQTVAASAIADKAKDLGLKSPPNITLAPSTSDPDSPSDITTVSKILNRIETDNIDVSLVPTAITSQALENFTPLTETERLIADNIRVGLADQTHEPLFRPLRSSTIRQFFRVGTQELDFDPSADVPPIEIKRLYDPLAQGQGFTRVIHRLADSKLLNKFYPELGELFQSTSQALNIEKLGALEEGAALLQNPIGSLGSIIKSKFGSFFGSAGSGISEWVGGTAMPAIRAGASQVLTWGRAAVTAGGQALTAVGGWISSGITAIGGAAATSEIWVPLLIVAVIIIIVVVIIAGVNSGSQVTPAGIGGDAEFNQYINVIKTANPKRFSQPNGTITYTYTIIPVSGALTDVFVTDQTTIYQESGSRQLNQVSAPNPPTTIESDWTSPEYTLSLNGSMNDSSITNLITVTAIAPDGNPVEVQVSASVIIGNPPFCAPTEPPIDSPYQSGWGYGSARTHCKSPTGHQGVDLGGSYTVKSPFLCESEVVFTGPSSNGFGNYVALRSLDGRYYTFLAHLESGIPVSVGQTIGARAVVGTMDNTGNSSGDHLHYEVRDSQKGGISITAGCQPSVTVNPCSITNLGGVSCFEGKP
jgi:murein DD-endopeptidase MepM/ murein hydrolase activator NlpD